MIFDFANLICGKPLPFAKPKVQFAKTGNLLASPWKFSRYGESGHYVSELFPKVARHVDDLCFIHSMHGTNPAHGAAVLKLHTGSDNFIRPSMGSWISYGLGTENQNLPSFISIFLAVVNTKLRFCLSQIFTKAVQLEMHP